MEDTVHPNYLLIDFCKISHSLTFIYNFQINRRRQWQLTPVLLPGKSHGQRSLVGCSPWGWEESDTTERLHFHFSLSCIGEGNGNPLQCSCLENPRDRGAWWAAVSGVTQSRTRLKRLSNNNNNNASLLLIPAFMLIPVPPYFLVLHHRQPLTYFVSVY